MDNKNKLTNEKVGKKFDNQFHLVTYAIGLATNMIKTGRQARVDLDSENPALLVLEEIAEDRDVLEDSCLETPCFEEAVIEKMIEVKEEAKVVLSE